MLLAFVVELENRTAMAIDNGFCYRLVTSVFKVFKCIVCRIDSYSVVSCASSVIYGLRIVFGIIVVICVFEIEFDLIWRIVARCPLSIERNCALSIAKVFDRSFVYVFGAILIFPASKSIALDV